MFKAKLTKKLNVDDIVIQENLSHFPLSAGNEFELFSSDDKCRPVVILTIYASLPEDAVEIINVKGKMEE